MRTKERIRQHEGVRYSPYRDSEGVWTAGVGRNLEAVPFSDDEVELMFANDFWRASVAARTLPCFDMLTDARQGVLVEMVFQMGLDGVKGFRKFLAAAQRSDWRTAHDEMLDSRWHKQTPERAERLAKIFLTGEYD